MAIWRGGFFFFFFFYWFLSFISPVLPITIKGTHYWPFVSGFHRWIPLTKASNAESASISWCHHERCLMIMITTWYWDLIIFITVGSMIIELRGFAYRPTHWIFMNNFGALQIHAYSSVVTWSALQWIRNIITWHSGKLIICILSWP